MRVCSRWQYGLVACTLIVVAGCGAKLTYKKTITMGATETHEVEWSDPLVNKATVTIKSPGAPVNAYLVLQANLEAAKTALERGQMPKDTLASKEKSEDITLEVQPGKKPFVLLLTTTGKKAEVEVTVDGK